MRPRQLSPIMARALSLALLLGFSISTLWGAQPKQGSPLSGIGIGNFGQMDGRFYRGSQPKEGDFKALAGLGIKTVIDLRDDPTRYEKRDSEAAGMRYFNIPMSDKKYPKDAQIEQFLKLVSDPATGRFYVHCAGGRHRTGVMGAIYRFNFYNWNYDQAYREMKDFDFYTRWGHGPLKRYVEDYYHRIQTGQIKPLASESASTTNLNAAPGPPSVPPQNLKPDPQKTVVNNSN